MGDERIYKIIFISQGNVCEIYARSVSQGQIFGFVEVEELLFGERSSIVVDPSEDSLKHEFKGVKRTHLPMHCVMRIDEVERPGSSRVTGPAKGGGSITPFPALFPTDAGKDRSKS